MALNHKNSCLNIVVGVLPTQKVSRCSGRPIWRWTHRRSRNRCDSVDRRRGRWTHRRGRWTHRRRQNPVDLDYLPWLGNLTRSRSWTRSVVKQSGFPIWLRLLEQSEVADVRVVVDVVADNNVLGRVEVDDEQSGVPEIIRLVIMNSFKTRTIWLRFLEQNEVANVRVVVDDNIHVVVDDNVVGRVEVDDDQSGYPERSEVANACVVCRMIAFV